MTKRTLLLCAATIILTACQAKETAAQDPAGANGVAAATPAADEQAIRDQVARWLQLVKAKDAAAIAELYAEDGAVMPPNAPIGKGAVAIEKTWAGMMQTPGFDLTFTPEQILVSSSGDMALDRGIYRLSASPPSGAVTDTGKYVVVWKKVAGEWKAAADIFNSDLAPTG